MNNHHTPTGTWETPQNPPPEAPPPLSPPPHAGAWSIAETIAALSRPLPEKMLSNKKMGGSTISFIQWHTVNKILDKYAPGWTWEVKSITLSPDRVFVLGRLTLQTSDGNIYREATGTEELKTTTRDGEVKEIAYGDPTSNAESMAFRRASARFGLGLYLYSK